MILTEFHKNVLLCNTSEEVFHYFMGDLKESLRTWDYFVNWSKVIAHVENIELCLNNLNYILGKDNFDEALKTVIEKMPDVVKVFPILIAMRDRSLKVLDSFDDKGLKYVDFDFQDSLHIKNNIGKIINFVRSSGLIQLFENDRIKNLVDYVYGVEVGLDSNGRKNRTGKMMEKVVEFYIKSICSKSKAEYITQATFANIKKKWNIEIPHKETNRRVDFAIMSKNKLFLIETNFYGVSGSKLKSTAGEYKSIYQLYKNNGLQFIWITDGVGWTSTVAPLKETFNEIDYLMNLDMLSRGFLEFILEEE